MRHVKIERVIVVSCAVEGGIVGDGHAADPEGIGDGTERFVRTFVGIAGKVYGSASIVPSRVTTHI